MDGALGDVSKDTAPSPRVAEGTTQRPVRVAEYWLGL